MKYLSTEEIPLKDIDVSNRLRVINPDWVEGLSESFANIGQKEPIEVVGQVRGKKYRLVAGGHRFAAAEKCGWKSIRAEIKQPVTDFPDLEIKLHEIDENLIRHGLNALDRAVFLGERQRVYEAMYPDSRADVAGGKKRQNPASDIVSFAESTAEKLDLSQRTVQRATAIFKSLTPALRAQISGTPLANKQGDLYQLTRVSEEQRQEVVDACLREENPASSVSVAIQELDGRNVPQISPEEKALKQLKDKYRSTESAQKEEFLNWLQDLGVISSFDPEQVG